MEWSMWEEFLDTKGMHYNRPSLILPQGVEDFVIYIDASNQGYRVVPKHDDKIVAYASR